MGRGSRTVDMELEAQIEVLRDNKRKYQHVIKLAQTLAGQLSQIMQTQRQLGDAFADLSLKSPELHVSRVDGPRWRGILTLITGKHAGGFI